MPRIRTVVTGVAVSGAVMVDNEVSPVSIGFGVVVSATASYTVEHTFDDNAMIAAGTATWFPHPFVASQTTNKDGNYAMPITAYRLNCAANTGTVTMTSIQGQSS
jgi:hypothetical protein